MDKWRLGLDLGTNSIGWCALKITDDSIPLEILDMGVRIFSDGREPAAEGRVGDSLAVQRRNARQMRKRRDRRNRQIRKVYGFFISSGIIDQDESAQIKRIDPYLVRKEGLDRVLNGQELCRAIAHLAKRRGFKSNRKEEKSGDAETKGNYLKISNLQNALDESDARTFGEFLYKKREEFHSLGVDGKCKGIRFRPEISNQYPDRKLYEEEFLSLRNIQEPSYPQLDWDLLYDIIFFQRPLKPQERGKCQFYIDKERAHKALPVSHRFRILQEVNNLELINSDGSKTRLTNGQRRILIQALDKAKTVAFNKIRSLLKVDNRFNLEKRADEKLNGNSTAFSMRKVMGKYWDDIALEKQDELIELLIESNSDEPIKNFLSEYNLDSDMVEEILNQTFSSGTTNLSKEFMNECSLIMEKKGLPYHEAVKMMGLHHSDFRNKEELKKRLPYYGEILKGSTIGGKPESLSRDPEILYGKIGNPTVHIALNQLRKLVNCLIERFGNPDEIVLELSRELKMSRDNKMDAFNRQKKNKLDNDRIYNQLKSLGIGHPSSWDIKKYKLWEELAPEGVTRRCVYCGKPISASQLFSPDVEIEHILPYSRTLMNSMNNLTVSHKRCNAFKGNRTPDEAFSACHDDFNYDKIVERSSHLPNNKSKFFLKGALHEWEEKAGFMDRQLTDNAYLSRKSKEYLSAICIYNKIWTIKGGQTAMLRARWGYNTILSNHRSNWHKNRTDHRHHSIDALVIALTDRSTIKRLANEAILQRPEDIIVPASPFLVRDVTEQVKKIIVSHKLDHGRQGKLFNETALGMKLKQTRRGFDKFKTIDDINQIESRSLKREFKDYVRELGINKARKIMAEKWHSDNDAEGPICLVPTYVTRKALKDLKATEVARIWDEEIKLKIYNEIQVSELNAKMLQEALQLFGEKHKIRRVRIMPDNTENAVRINSVNKNKAYLPNDYLYVDIWAIPPHKNKKKTEYKGYFVNRVQAQDEKFKSPCPHPAAKKIMSLYKEDIVKIIDEENKTHYSIIKGYAATTNRIDFSTVFNATNLKDWNEHTNIIIKDDIWKPQKGQNWNSINQVFQTYLVSKVHITADGRERT